MIGFQILWGRVASAEDKGGQGGCLGRGRRRRGFWGGGAVCTVNTVGNSQGGAANTPAGGHLFWTAVVGQ